MAKSLTERNLYAIYAVLADYRQARDQHDTQAIADIAAGLDAWLRSLLEIVKGHKVIWFPFPKRMPANGTVWACIDGEVCVAWFDALGYEWWVDGQLVSNPTTILWTEFRWPDPPKEGGDEE